MMYILLNDKWGVSHIVLIWASADLDWSEWITVDEPVLGDGHQFIGKDLYSHDVRIPMMGWMMNIDKLTTNN